MPGPLNVKYVKECNITPLTPSVLTLHSSEQPNLSPDSFIRRKQHPIPKDRQGRSARLFGRGREEVRASDVHVTVHRDKFLIYYNNPTRCSCAQSILFYYSVTLHVSVVFHTHHQEYINCIYSLRYRSYCKVQKYFTQCIHYSTCFGCFPHSSSGVH